MRTPILKWAGGKRQLLPQMQPHLPSGLRLIEPFFGGGAVWCSYQGVGQALLNDWNPEIVNLLQAVRQDPSGLMNHLDRMALQYSKDFYLEVRSKVPESPVERAARMVFINKCGFNGLWRVNRAGLCNVPWGQRPTCPALYDRRNLLDWQRALQEATVSQGDFAPVIDQAGPGDLVYCDPPYDPVKPDSHVSYTEARFDLSDQTRLRDVCFAAAARGARVVVSNSDTERMRELWSEAQEIHTLSARRAINRDATGRGAINELLIRV